MEYNAADLGTRVTRSLRKRLTSVDGENSSRSGSPNLAKFTSISEISSPSKSSRMTRRNSSSGVTTPVKTPAKRVAVILEKIENITPVRRSTRKRSVSGHDQEDIDTGVKIPTFATLDEETEGVDKKNEVVPSESNSPKEASKSRSKRISPNISENKKNDEYIKKDVSKKKKPGPKSRTFEHDEDISDVEISIDIDETENVKIKSPNITTIVLTDDDLNINPNDYIKENGSKTIKDVSKDEGDVKGCLNVNDLQLTDNISELHSKEKYNELKNGDAPHFQILDEEVKKSSEAPIKSPQVEVGCNEKRSPNVSMDNKRENINLELTAKDNIDVISTEVVEFNIDVHNCTTFETKENVSLSDKLETATSTPYRGGIEDSTSSVCKESLKKVDFTCSPDNSFFKNVYPKTPVSVKTLNTSKNINSCRDNDSFQAKDASRINSDNQNSIIKNNENWQTDTVNKSEIQIEITTNTPIGGLKSLTALETVPMQTQINFDNDKVSELLLKEEEKASEDNEFLDKESSTQMEKNTSEKHTEICEAESSENDILHKSESNSVDRNKIEIKWVNPSVRGATTNGSKLDVLVSQNQANDCSNTANNVNKKIEKKKNLSIVPSSENEEDFEESKLEEEEEEEESFIPNHEFEDYEAMEVDDYESGDSMDSEERREIEENEIPFYAESIGSYSSDCEQEYSESSGKELALSNSFSESSVVDEEISERNSKKNKKKKYKRLVHLHESSSSDEENKVDQQNTGQESMQSKNPHKSQETHDQSLKDRAGTEQIKKENITKHANLRTNSDSNSEKSISEKKYMPRNSGGVLDDENKAEKTNISQEIAEESKCNKMTYKNIDEDKQQNSPKIIRGKNPQDAQEIQNESFKSQTVKENMEEENVTNAQYLNKSSEYKPRKSISEKSHFPNKSGGNSILESTLRLHCSGESDLDECNVESISMSKKEMLQIPNDSAEESVSVTSESDADENNESKSNDKSHSNSDIRLNASVDKSIKLQVSRKSQESITVDVIVKDEELETMVPDENFNESASYNTDKENKDINHRRKFECASLALGNPLIRPKRQSLALPTNPDTEIGPSPQIKGNSKKTNRRSFAALSDIDFHPSQSFTEILEVQKKAHKKLVEQQKLVSKSFCGASDSHDSCIVDIDVANCNNSKLIFENATSDYHNNSNESTNSGKVSAKVSSTPREDAMQDDFNRNYLILKRCDEILEAANNAKLEAKIRSKKNKPKKLRKRPNKKSTLKSTDETHTDNMLRRISKEINRKDKIKVAVAHAIKGEDAVVFKKKKNVVNNTKDQKNVDGRQLAADVLNAIGESVVTKKMIKHDIIKKHKKIAKVSHQSSTSAGNIVELPQSPQKKRKKSTYIQLPTGKVSIEPVSPKTRIVDALNGMEFKESPITPAATRFRVETISPPKNHPLQLSSSKKRKRHQKESFQNSTASKPQWTQSGFFTEQDVQKNNPEFARSGGKQSFSGLQKAKYRLTKREHHKAKLNFKENALMRSDIPRSSKRETFLLKERKQNRGHY